MQKLKKYKLWYWIFLIMGIVGVTNIASYFFMLGNNYYNNVMGNLGYLELLHCHFLDTLFWSGSELTGLAHFIMNLSSILVSLVNLSIVWLVLAFILKRKVKAIESPTEENIQKLKHLPAITVVAVAAIIIFLMCIFIVSFE